MLRSVIAGWAGGLHVRTRRPRAEHLAGEALWKVWLAEEFVDAAPAADAR